MRRRRHARGSDGSTRARAGGGRGRSFFPLFCFFFFFSSPPSFFAPSPSRPPPAPAPPPPSGSPCTALRPRGRHRFRGWGGGRAGRLPPCTSSVSGPPRSPGVPRTAPGPPVAPQDEPSSCPPPPPPPHLPLPQSLSASLPPSSSSPQEPSFFPPHLPQRLPALLPPSLPRAFLLPSFLFLFSRAFLLTFLRVCLPFSSSSPLPKSLPLPQSLPLPLPKSLPLPPLLPFPLLFLLLFLPFLRAFLPPPLLLLLLSPPRLPPFPLCHLCLRSSAHVRGRGGTAGPLLSTASPPRRGGGGGGGWQEQHQQHSTGQPGKGGTGSPPPPSHQGVHYQHYIMLKMSNSNTTQETLEIMKESEKKLVEESVNKNKFVSRSPSKEEVEKDGEEISTRQESQRRTANHGHARKRAKSNSKLKLVRSLAVCEESSSPFVDGPLETQDIVQLHISCPSDREDDKSAKEGVEKEEKEKNKEKVPKKMLSRDSSQEYTDSTGIDLHEFLVNTLKKNPRDRMMLLKLEQEILEFINDNNNQFKKFPQMTSYHRMLLHRVAAYFGMDHNVDQTGKAVIINKTGNTRIPEQRFSEHIKDEKSSEFPQRFILKRDDSSMDRDDNQIRIPLQDGRRSKSIEEREEEYQRIRERIFARESGQNGFLNDSRLAKEGFSSSSHKRRQIFRGNRDGLNRTSGSRQSSTESDMKSLEPRPWSSTDSDGSARNLRPPVTKASSFSGISILTRGDSIGGIGKGSSTSRTVRPGLSLSTPEACSQVSSAQPGRGLLPCSAQQQQQHQPLPPTPQQQPAMSNHIISQPVPALQPSPQPVQYSPSSCPQVLLPVSPPQQYNMADELSSPFGQISLSRQGSTEAPDPSSAMFQPPIMSQHPQQTGFIMASPGQPITASNYSASGHTAPAQQVLQPQNYMQPPQQIQVSYYPPGQYPNSSQQYRPLSHPVAYSPQRSQQLPQQSQQPGLQPIMSNQQQTYQGMMGVQQSQGQSLLSNQRSNMGGQIQSMMGVQQSQNQSLLNNQRGNMGSQMQGLMVQYTPLPSYQQVPVANESQSVVQQPFQQPVLVPANQSVQGGLQAGGMPVYYSVIPPAQQNGTSPSVSFLQPPGTEQYQMPQSPSPCSPPQMQQQYSGVSPTGPGVVVMQLNVPNGPQPPQNPSMVQWNHCKYYSLDQRGQKPGDIYNPDTSAQASNTQLNSPITSPTQSPTPSPVTSLSSVCTGLSPLPVLTQFPRPVGPAQGDGRYSLLGQPLQYNLSICPPPLLHNQSSYTAHQGQTGMKHGNRGKKQALKSASTDLGTSDVASTVLGRVLEVTDLPEGITRTEADKLFTQLAMSGAKIQWLKETQGRPGGGGDNNHGTAENGRHSDLAALYTIVAVFPSPMAAQNASLRLNSPLSRFKLRTAKKNYDLRVLERASSQ